MIQRAFLISFIALFFMPILRAEDRAKPFKIEIVDDENEQPIPLIELRTTSELRWVSDNAGVVAIDAPELFDREVWFGIQGHGYRFKEDGFGYRGLRVTPKHGGASKVRLHREMIAQRIGRLTGSGLLAESQKLGEHPDYRESGVTGCDSVVTTAWKGKRFWLWGDTKVFRYPLGVFNTLGATTELKPFDVSSQPIKPTFQYFRKEDGMVRGIANIPAKGPVWLSGLVSLRDSLGTEHLVASYVVVKEFLTVVERGLCEWNSERESFEPMLIVWKLDETAERQPEAVLIPDGHVVRYRDEANQNWLLFANPLPRVKLHDSYEAWKDPKAWHSIDVPKTLQTKEGATLQVHQGAMAWSDYRSSWFTIFTQSAGDSSYLGEVWFAESDSPFGPWTNLIKIVTHNNYTFYNPCIHADWTEPGSSAVYFEGTYTAEFAKHPEKTPRYDYNQILYRLDLNELPAKVSR